MYICDPCILAAVGVTASGQPAKDPNLEPVASSSQVLCSFCRKSRDQVEALISGPAREGRKLPNICGECLGLCGEILSEQLR
ncbi:MAG: ClpX C4-type zinc finger protein [Acidimicrobiales bacterium]